MRTGEIRRDPAANRRDIVRAAVAWLVEHAAAAGYECIQLAIVIEVAQQDSTGFARIF